MKKQLIAITLVAVMAAGMTGMELIILEMPVGYME